MEKKRLEGIEEGRLRGISGEKKTFLKSHIESYCSRGFLKYIHIQK